MVRWHSGSAAVLRFLSLPRLAQENKPLGVQGATKEIQLQCENEGRRCVSCHRPLCIELFVAWFDHAFARQRLQKPSPGVMREF